jgi:hypothetical protein
VHLLHASQESPCPGAHGLGDTKWQRLGQAGCLGFYSNLCGAQIVVKDRVRAAGANLLSRLTLSLRFGAARGAQAASRHAPIARARDQKCVFGDLGDGPKLGPRGERIERQVGCVVGHMVSAFVHVDRPQRALVVETRVERDRGRFW